MSDTKSTQEGNRLFQEVDRRQYDSNFTDIFARLENGDRRMCSMEQTLNENTEITRRIYSSLGSVVTFTDDLTAGAKFMCRVAKGVQFLANDIIKPMWFPAVVVYLVYYMITHHFTLPDWVFSLMGNPL